MPPQPRTIGRYAVIERLGQGGMGVVYRAWDPDLRRQVAIKVISSPRAATADPAAPDSAGVDDDLFERFAREAQAAASLAHPNIVTIFDCGRHVGRPYIVMELVDGRTLAQAIHADAGMPLARRVELAIDLCEGLGYAHEQGIVHRDVKPANLVIAAAGPLKILDFGIARLTDELASRPLTQAGGLIGTPQYMSPEQVSGQPVDARSDIFAVGTVLYELFTGRLAFSAPTPALIPALVLQQTPPAIHDLVPGFPASLEDVVTRAMEKDPARRFQRLDDVAVRLREWLEAQGAEGHGVSPEKEDVAEATGSRAELAGLLAHWEDAIGEMIDTPVVLSDEENGEARLERPPTIERRAPRRRGPWGALTIAATLVLAGATAFWLVGRREKPVDLSPSPQVQPEAGGAAIPAATPEVTPAATPAAGTGRRRRWPRAARGTRPAASGADSRRRSRY